MLNKTVGENIKNRRKELGMTQQELADLVGYTNRSTIARIEKGDVDLNESRLIKIAEALNTTAHNLLGWEKKEKKINLSILTEEEKKDVENLINMTNIMFMSGNKELSENDRNTIIKAYIDVLLNKRKEKGRKWEKLLI